VEDDPPNPRNVYGRTKLAGELAVQQSGASHLIFRTEWVYAREGRNFLLTILRLAAEREELRIVNDQIGAPTWSREIAGGTAAVLSQLLGREGGLESTASANGIYHLTAGGQTSWYDFARAILEEASRQNVSQPWLEAARNHKPIMTRRVVPISTEEYPTPACRPAYSVLSNARVKRVFGVELPDWREQLRTVFIPAIL
jgi:dTDP-4-dehydrorhamnose reductase